MNAISPISFSSCYSFGQGAVTPARMAAALKAAGIAILPLTDMMSLAGLPEAMTAAANFGLSLLTGVSCTTAGGTSLRFYPDDHQAFTSLNASISHYHCLRSRTAGFNPDTALWLKLLGNGRIIIGGTIDREILAILTATDWKCFLALEDSLSVARYHETASLARHFAIPVILAPHLTAATTEDINLNRLIRAIDSGALLNDIQTEESALPRELKKYADMAARFPEAAAENRKFCSQPGWIPVEGKLQMPQFCSNSAESIDLLRRLAVEGLQRRFGQLSSEIQNRFASELEIIEKLGFADYFLVVNDITIKARELGHRVLGRGSAANSLISYALDFTQVDPLKYNLYFERFLNSARKSPPDIDLDFSWRIRDQIYQYLLERWGSDKVAMICTHISLRGRAALRETGKTLGIRKSDLDAAAALIGHSSLAQFLADPERVARFKMPDERRKILSPMFKLAAQIEGIPTHFSIHAGGIVIAPGSIHEFTPTMPSSKALPITQLEMHGAERFGLVKLDLLSQRSLGVYSDLASAAAADDRSERSITNDQPSDCSPAITLPPSDPELIENDQQVASALANGRTMGVFYIESPGMRGLLKKLGCRTYLGLVAASSIIRPGVAESGMMQEYIRRHHHGSWQPLHPIMGELLGETYGVMVYQEDVMKVAHHIAGFSLAEADVLRRAMSGKERSHDRMAATRQRFLDGAAARNIPIGTASEIWRQIDSFCGYAFCKAHSAAYAVLSLELLWFKVHFPGPFMTAVLNNRGGFYGSQAYVSEARRLGLQILPPDINSSQADFTCREKQILTGLSFINSLQQPTIIKIISERSAAPFSSFADFIARIRPAADELEALTGSGAMRSFGTRAALRWRAKLMNTGSLFDEPLPALPPLAMAAETRPANIAAEIRSLGFSVTGHPLELIRSPVNCCPADRLPEMIGRHVKICGLLTAAKSVTTSRSERMKFLTIEDRTGLIEVVMFPRAWEKCRQVLDYTSVVEISGSVKSDQGSITLHGETLTRHNLQES